MYGLDGASCAGRVSSPVDKIPVLRVPSTEVPSMRQHFQEKFFRFSLVRRVLSTFYRSCCASDRPSYS